MSKLDDIFAKHKPTGESLKQFEDVKRDIKRLVLEGQREVLNDLMNYGTDHDGYTRGVRKYEIRSFIAAIDKELGGLGV